MFRMQNSANRTRTFQLIFHSAAASDARPLCETKGLLSPALAFFSSVKNSRRSSLDAFSCMASRNTAAGSILCKSDSVTLPSSRDAWNSSCSLNWSSELNFFAAMTLAERRGSMPHSEFTGLPCGKRATSHRSIRLGAPQTTNRVVRIRLCRFIQGQARSSKVKRGLDVRLCHSHFSVESKLHSKKPNLVFHDLNILSHVRTPYMYELMSFHMLVADWSELLK